MGAMRMAVILAFVVVMFTKAKRAATDDEVWDMDPSDLDEDDDWEMRFPAEGTEQSVVFLDDKYDGESDIENEEEEDEDSESAFDDPEVFSEESEEGSVEQVGSGTPTYSTYDTDMFEPRDKLPEHVPEKEPVLAVPPVEAKKLEKKALEFLEAYVSLFYPGTLSCQDAVDCRSSPAKKFKEKDTELHRQFVKQAKDILKSRGVKVPDDMRALYRAVIFIALQSGVFKAGRGLFDVVNNVCGTIWVANLNMLNETYKRDVGREGPMQMPVVHLKIFQVLRIDMLEMLPSHVRLADEWYLAINLYVLHFSKQATEREVMTAAKRIRWIVTKPFMETKHKKPWPYYPEMKLKRRTRIYVAIEIVLQIGHVPNKFLSVWRSILEKTVSLARKDPNFPEGHELEVFDVVYK